MNNPPKISWGRWIYFGVFIFFIGFALELLWAIRVAMKWILEFYFSGERLPWLTERINFSGPYYPESSFAVTIVALTTLIGLAVIMKGHARAAYTIY